MPDQARKSTLRYVYLVLGLISLSLGVVGIFLPVFPTTPFLLLAAFLFLRSSQRMYDWLISHPKLGPQVCDYIDGLGIPMASKKKAVALLWASITLSVVLVGVLTYFERGPLFAMRHVAWLAGGLALIASLVSVYIFSRPTCPPRDGRDR